MLNVSGSTISALCITVSTWNSDFKEKALVPDPKV